MRRYLVTAILSLVLVSTGAIGEAFPTCPEDARWSLVIDAGSSGSRLRFYCWKPGMDGGLPSIEDRGSQKVEPGVADPECTRGPQEAVASLRPLIDAALETVDEARRGSTPLALLATAGLRQCPKSYQENLLAGIREYLAETPFANPRAKLITGREEALYGWTAVNYLLDRLDPTKPLVTVGALDLGGGSTQITFLPRHCPSENSECGEVEVGDRSFSLYTRSYLGWGQDEAMRRIASPACYLRGYRAPDGSITGRGRYAACRRAIRRGMRDALRHDPPESPCRESCNRLGAYQPPLSGELLAFSAFAYTTEFLGLESELTLDELVTAGKRYCRTPWQEVATSCETSPRPGCKEEWLNRYCFASAHVVTLVHDVYGLPMDHRLTSTNELGGAGIDWTLGVLVEIATARAKLESGG